jgi:hypothetical protein
VHKGSSNYNNGTGRLCSTTREEVTKELIGR